MPPETPALVQDSLELRHRPALYFMLGARVAVENRFSGTGMQRPLMQEATTIGPRNSVPWDVLTGQSLVTLLALVGTKRMDLDALRERTKLAPQAFEDLLAWLQREYLVDVIAGLEGDKVKENVSLTERGEAALVSMLESTCELPDLR
jgi:hypothetical protein